MKLDITEWKPFFLSKLFKIRMGNGLDKDKMTNANPKVNFVCRGSYNNGVDIKVDKVNGIEPFPAGFVTVALGGSIGSCFVQEEPFYTAQNIAVMESITTEMSYNIKLFISTLVGFECKTKYYAFGRELNTHINRDFSLNLPVQRNIDGKVIIDNKLTYSDEGYIPDWQFMENYIKSLNHKPITTRNRQNRLMAINVEMWKEFKLGKLITDIYKAKAINRDDLKNPDNGDDVIRYITRTAEDNGCELIVSKSSLDTSVIIERPNAITIGDTTATCFYQNEEFIAGDHMVVVRANWLNKRTAMFILTILNNEQYKYSYGRAFLMERIKETIIKLPIRTHYDGTPLIDNKCTYSDKGYIPDWEFMEDFIEALPYGDRL